VQVLEDQQERLHLALPQQQALEGVQGVLTALWRIEGLPSWILPRRLRQGQEGRQGQPEGRSSVTNRPVTVSRMRRPSSRSSSGK
jgi:hypothetical protein